VRESGAHHCHGTTSGLASEARASFCCGDATRAHAGRPSSGYSKCSAGLLGNLPRSSGLHSRGSQTIAYQFGMDSLPRHSMAQSARCSAAVASPARYGTHFRSGKSLSADCLPAVGTGLCWRNCRLAPYTADEESAEGETRARGFSAAGCPNRCTGYRRSSYLRDQCFSLDMNNGRTHNSCTGILDLNSPNEKPR